LHYLIKNERTLNVRITNERNLPEALVKAVENDSYSMGDADKSVTGLLQPPRQAALRELHADEVTEDASDRVYALLGQLAHLLLERAGEQDRNSLTEERLYTDVQGFSDEPAWRISGQTDTITLTPDQEGYTISDYKLCTVWKFKRDKFDPDTPVMPEEYEQQLNMYAHLLRVNGFQVDALKIVAMYRDWSIRESERDQSYPQNVSEIHDVKLWDAEVAKWFIEDRVRAHQEAISTYRYNVDDLVECSDEERWAKPAKYALKTNAKNVRARKLFDSQEDAVGWAEDPANKMKAGWVVEYRPGENVRCQRYCNVAEFCSQWQNLKNEEAKLASKEVAL